MKNLYMIALVGILSIVSLVQAANYNAIHAVDSLTIWVAGQQGAIRRSTDGGQTWQDVSTDANNSFHDIFAIDAQSAIAVGAGYRSDGLLQKQYYLTAETVNSGQTWQETLGETGEILNQAEGVSITWNADEDIWSYALAVVSGKLYYSSGSVANPRPWESGYSNQGFYFFDVHTRGNYGWAVGGSGIIYKTYNYGKEWWRKDCDTDSDIVAVYFADAEHGWAVTYGGEVLSTDDVGDTWSVQKIDDDFLVGVHFYNTLNGIVVGISGQVFHTRDGGINWQRLDLGLGANTTFFDVAMLTPKKAIAVGWDDLILPIDLDGASAPVVDPQTISALWGPPDQLNQWQTFTVPLTAASFGVDDATFAGVLASVSKIRFRTEMNDGADTGKIDVVRIGDRFFSDFRFGQEDWAAEGDGTMSWIESDGPDGNGYIQIADWTSGDWHYAVAPPSWSGDLRGLIGQDVTFAYQTNAHSSNYRGAIEISNEAINRLLLTTPRWTLPPGSSEQLTFRLSKSLAQDLTIQLDSSNPGSFTIAANTTIPAGQTSASIGVTTPTDAVDGSSSVITATAAGFPATRLTLTIDKAAAETIIAPNATYNGTLAGQVRVYYAVPVTADGNLAVTLTPTQNANIQLMLCTPEKNEIVRADSWGNPLTLNVNGLKPDTYYISLWGYYDANNDVAFSIQTQFGAAALQNDVEPNDTFAEANVLPLNGQKTGHIGYDGRWQTNPADLVDWWQVTTVEDGRLTVTISQIEEVNLQLAIYRPDGITEIIRQDTWGDTTSLTINNMRNGTFFVHVYRYSNNFTPYTLQNTFVPASGNNDPEPNDSAATAAELALAKTVAGHLGYNGYRESLGLDTIDWWHFTLTESTDLQIKLTQNAAANLRMRLFKADSVTVVHNGSDTQGAGYEMNVANAAPAKYYLSIMTYGVHDSYSLSTGTPTAEPQTLSAVWGPPNPLNQWQTFTVPLTAAQFGVDDATFAGVLASVSKIRFRTEMNSGPDTGKLDVVRIGDRFFSDFRFGQEDWAAEGDGTMSWIDSGGLDGNGYIQVADWASGDWHYAVAPPSWSGDWSALIGQNITFAYQTDHVCCGYTGVIEISNEPVNRLLLTTPRWTLPPGSSEQLILRLSQPLDQDLTIGLNSSNTSSFTVTASAQIPAGQTSITTPVTAKADATEGSTSVITATASGFPPARLTLTIGETVKPDSGVGVRINAIDTNNFPTLSCWISALDRTDNTPIEGITAAQITLTEDGVAQAPTSVQAVGPGMDGKADIVFVVDVTGGMANYLEKFKNWASCIDEWLNDATVGIDGRYGLVTFAEEVLSATGLVTDFAEIQAQIGAISPQATIDGKANALNALAKAAEFDYRPNSVRLVVLLTDKPYYQQGQGGAGSTTLNTVTLALELYVKQISAMVIAPDLLDFHELAQEAEGLFFELDIDDLSMIFCRIGRLLGSQTVVTFVSSNTQATDDVRSLRLTLTHDAKTHETEQLFVVGATRVRVTPPEIIGRVGNTFEVAVEVENMVDLGLVHFYLQYDPSKIKAEQIVESDFLSQGGSSTTFVAAIEPNNSRIDISATRLNDSGIGAGGSGILCRVSFSVLVPDCGSTIAIPATDRVFKTLNDTPIAVTTQAATIYPISTGGQSDLLGDFDEDLDIDTRDFALLATYWKPSNTAIGDIGPGSGTPPFLTVLPDNQVNFEDLFVFTRMWNWYHANLAAQQPLHSLQKSPVAGLEWRLQNADNASLRCELWAENLPNAAMGRLILSYPADDWRLIQASPGGLPGVSAAWFVDHDDRSGSIEIAMARLVQGDESPVWSGSGSLVVLELAAHGQTTGALSAKTVDLRDPNGESLSLRIAEDLPLVATATPSHFNLEPNYPNPFNNRTRLTFNVPQQAWVQIRITDVLGRPVKTVLDQTCQAGQHTMDWRGTDDRGQPVASGIYWIHMQSGSFNQSRRILFLK
ncbi:T9SS type A sorting domain-containing protein [candidate division KSB1 bacterium]|nr:T9SS type A sorting domain-containing protein [candidate division KSB1 bacterium]